MEKYKECIMVDNELAEYATRELGGIKMTKEELKKEAEDLLKKSLKVDDDEFNFFKNEAICKEEIKRLADFVEPREKRIEILEKENRVLKCFIKDLIYENYNTCFQSSNTTCLFNSDYRNRAEELIGEKL